MRRKMRTGVHGMLRTCMVTQSVLLLPPPSLAGRGEPEVRGVTTCGGLLKQIHERRGTSVLLAVSQITAVHIVTLASL